MIWYAVFKKETLELLRDRRVAFGAFVMPALSILLMFQLIGGVISSVKKQQKSTITFVTGSENSALAKSFKDNNIDTVPSLEAGRKKVESGETKLVIQLAPDFQSNLSSDKTGLITAVYDSTNPLSQVMFQTFRAQLSEQSKDIVGTRVASKGLDAAIVNPIDVKPVDVAKDAAKQGESLASFLPYLIVLWAFYGGMSVVSDMVAGEKEKGTLETLLISPTRRTELVLGKYASLFLLCLVSSLCALLGVVIASLTTRNAEALFGEKGFSLPLPTFILILTTLLPLVAFFASILLAVSSWAKNSREASTYLAVVSFIVLIPAVFSNIIGFTDIGRAAYIGYVPVLNSAVVIRGALLGNANWTVALQSAAVGFALAAVFLWLIVRMFHRETILAKS